jgi:DNA-directed RNA polymerase subunit RPC12/RpoP
MAGWYQSEPVQGVAYICAFCGNQVGALEHYRRLDTNDCVYICATCQAPTSYWKGTLHPSPRFGRAVQGLPADIAALYDEARGCMSVPAHTGAVLLCRKILMHVAVEVGAGTGLKFIEYVEYLADQHYVPPNAKGWVDHIREKGNEATHEIVQMSKEEAEQLMSFTEVLLQLMYELPQRVPGAEPPSQ